MSGSTSGTARDRALRLGTRDITFWFFGLGTAITVNKVSESDQVIKIIFVCVMVAAAMAGKALLDAKPETSRLRHYAPDVLLAVATPLILLAAVGVWGDYTMVAAAALITVATLTAPHDTMTRYTRLTGMTLLGFGVIAVSLPVREPANDAMVTGYLIGFGVLAIAGGMTLVIKGNKAFAWMSGLAWADRWRLASQELFLGLLLAAGTVAGVPELFRLPGGVALAVVMIGAAVVLIGSSVVVLLRPARRQWVKKQWRELRRERQPGEQYPGLGKLVISSVRFTTDRPARSVGVGPAAWEERPQPTAVWSAGLTSMRRRFCMTDIGDRGQRQTNPNRFRTVAG